MCTHSLEGRLKRMFGPKRKVVEKVVRGV